MNCLKCETPGGRTDTHSKRGNTKTDPRRRTTLTPDDSASDGSVLLLSHRAKGNKSANYHEESESDRHHEESESDCLSSH